MHPTSSSKHSRHQTSKAFWMELVFRQLVRWQMKSRLVVHAMQCRDPNWESKISTGLTAAWPAWENRDQILSIVPIAFGDIAFTPPFENHLLRSSCDAENPWLFRAICTSYTAFVFSIPSAPGTLRRPSHGRQLSTWQAHNLPKMEGSGISLEMPLPPSEKISGSADSCRRSGSGTKRKGKTLLSDIFTETTKFNPLKQTLT